MLFENGFVTLSFISKSNCWLIEHIVYTCTGVIMGLNKKNSKILDKHENKPKLYSKICQEGTMISHGYENVLISDILNKKTKKEWKY